MFFANLVTPRRCSGVLEVDGFIYVFAGIEQKGPVQSIEKCEIIKKEDF